jgi:hypothetical protein
MRPSPLPPATDSHGLPTAPGVYVDLDGDAWRLDPSGLWFWLTAHGVPVDPELAWPARTAADVDLMVPQSFEAPGRPPRMTPALPAAIAHRAPAPTGLYVDDFGGLWWHSGRAWERLAFADGRPPQMSHQDDPTVVDTFTSLITGTTYPAPTENGSRA